MSRKFSNARMGPQIPVGAFENFLRIRPRGRVLKAYLLKAMFSSQSSAAVKLIESIMSEPLNLECQNENLEKILLNSETFPTAMEAAESIAGVPFIGTSPRFSKGKWFIVDPPSVNCPECESKFLSFRSPYITKAGQMYFYWALACPTCQTIIEPTNLSGEDRKQDYKASRYRPIKIDAK